MMHSMQIYKIHTGSQPNTSVISTCKSLTLVLHLMYLATLSIKVHINEMHMSIAFGNPFLVLLILHMC